MSLVYALKEHLLYASLPAIHLNMLLLELMLDIASKKDIWKFVTAQ